MIQDEVAGLFQEISLLLQEHMKSLFHEYGIPFNYSMVIRYVVNHPGETVSEIARGLNQSKGHISVLLEKMLRDGLIFKDTDPDDQRVLKIYPTDRSLKIRDSFMTVYRKLLAKVLSPLDSDSLQKMITALQSIRDGLKTPDLQAELQHELKAALQETLGITKFCASGEERSEEDGTNA